MASDDRKSHARTSKVVLRPRKVLSNVAAEYVELGAGRDLCRRATGGLVDVVDEPTGASAIHEGCDDTQTDAPPTTIQAPQYARALDRFMPADQVERHDAQYYEQSLEAAEKFKLTLKQFVASLESNRVFQDLDLECREPDEFDIDYVLKIANTIQKRKEGPENTRKLKDFIRKISQKIVKHKDGLTSLLGMIPSDIYGSLISGGFSVILLAVEKHEKLRLEIQNTLAIIPQRLYEVRRLSELPHTTPQLHNCADQLFLSIFKVLESVITKVMNTSSYKWRLRSKDKRVEVASIEDAIDSMKKKVKEFRDAAVFSTELRIGRMEEKVDGLYGLFDILEEHLSTRSAVNQQQPTQSDKKQLETLAAALVTQFYKHLKSNPNVEMVNGIATRRDNEPRALPSSPKSGPLISPKDYHYLVDKWFSGLGDIEVKSDNQVAESLVGFATLSPGDKDKMSFIITCNEYKAWLDLDGPKILSVQEDDAPAALINALTVSAAMLAVTLSRMIRFPVLSFFCGLKQQESDDGLVSGAQTIRTCLNGQLLHFMMEYRETVSLDFLQDKRLLKRSQSSPTYARILFRNLLEALPSNDVVFIIIDSFSRLRGQFRDGNAGDKLMDELIALTRELPVTIKLLVTDALPACPIHDEADIKIHIPEDVDGWRSDVNLESIDEQSTLTIGRIVAREDQDDLVSDEMDSDDLDEVWPEDSSDSDSD